MTDNQLNFNNDYDDIKIQEVFTNDTENSVVSETDLLITPFDVIKKLATEMGQEICDPKSNCKHCHGRGFTGRDSKSKAPIPCKCIQPNFNDEKNVRLFNQTRKLSRQERRERDRKIKRGLR